MTRSSFLSVAVVLFTGLVGCDKKESSPTTAIPSAAPVAEAKSVLVLNAASTKDAMNEIAASFQKASGITVKFSPEDSSKLANQIAQGAPADIFLSANEKWANFVNDKGMASQTKPLLGNTLVVVAPKGNPAKVAKAEDLKGAGVKRLAVAGPTVPAGIYAKEALTSLKLWDDLEKAKKITPGENVRSTLTFVERGEAEAGVVYATDAKISDKIEVVYTFDASSHAKIVYPLVLLKKGAANPAATKFFEHVLSKEASDVFKKHGFTSLTSS